MPLMTVKTIEYSCRPWAVIDVDRHADAMDRILDALETDERALGAGGVGFNDKTGEVSSVFQVEVADGGRGRDRATAAAQQIFDDALRAAGLEQRTAGVSVVRGDDPDLLP